MKLSPAFLAYKLSSAFSVLAPENLPLSGTLELPGYGAAFLIKNSPV